MPADPAESGTVSTQRPVRTCIGCRQRAVATELLRIVVMPQTDTGTDNVSMIVADTRRCLPGRGAWLHPDPACVELAQRRRAIGRALRVSSPIDPTPLSEYVAQQLQDRQ
ncbi:MAG: YlxR family protein [Jatrophihabitans sp.]